MKTITRQLKIKLLALLFSLPFIGISQSTATYTVTFNSVWNSTDHGTLPSNAHWSKLVGVNHNNSVSFVGLGQIATEGIEKVAEKGENEIFESEVNAEITNGNAEQYIDGNSLSTATGNITISALQVSESYPLLTLVSMIAPSPDWMIMVNSLDLRENGQWKTSITVDLYPIDAGTDSGTSYTAGNIDTDPQVPISVIQNMYGFNDQKIGTLTVILDDVLSVNTFNTPEESLSVFPNPNENGKLFLNSRNHIMKSVTLYNVLGKKVYSTPINTTSIDLDLDQLNAGIYIADIAFEDQTRVTKRIVFK